MSEQFLQAVKVDGLRLSDPEPYVSKILATIVVSKDQRELRESLTTIVRELASSATIGKALQTLHSVATTGNEYHNDKDGIDALCYTLSARDCRYGIQDLRAVLYRFGERED